MKSAISGISLVFLLFLLTSTSAYASENQSSITTVDETIDQLIKELGSSNATTKANAAKILVDIGDPAVESLIAALKNENYDIRENSALVLGKIGNEKAINPLIEALSEQGWEKTQEEREFGKALETALGSFGEPAVEPLSEFIDNNADENEYNGAVSHAIAALGTIQGPSISLLIELLDDPEYSPEAAYELRQIGEPAEPFLIPLLEDENPHVRYRAAESLIGTTNPDAVEPLTKLLDDEYVYAANMARIALERMESQTTPTESFLHGREREFFLEDEKREWLDSLVPIVKGRSRYIEPYFYPDGPVISYGLNYQGYLSVHFLIGSEVNESYMGEIYGIIDEKARENGIEEVPVLFSFESMPIEDIAIEENPPAENPEFTIENNTSTSLIQGFTAVMLLILLIGICLVWRTWK